MTNHLLVLLFCCFSGLTFAQENDAKFDSLYVFKKDTVRPETPELAPLKPIIHQVLTSSYLSDTNSTSIAFVGIPCPYTVENAKKMIEQGVVEIVIRGGFQGFPKENEKRSAAFRKKYKVNFDYVGCCIFYNPEGEDIPGYNKVMKDYLKKKYGANCIEEYKAIFS